MKFSRSNYFLGILRRFFTAQALVISFFGAAKTTAATFETEILNDAPIAYYRFNDGVATATYDTANNLGTLGAPGNAAYTTTVVHGVTGALTGSSDTAAQFVNKGCSVPFNAALNNQGSFTVEAWLKPTSGDTPSYTCALSSVNVTSPRKGWLILSGLGGRRLEFPHL